MQAYRPDRVVRVLTALVSTAYFLVVGAAVLVLVGAPAVKLFASGHPEWVWDLNVPATALDAEATVRTSWGAARLFIGDARAHLQLPIAMLPWWFVGVLWTHAAVTIGLLLLSLHHLRRIFQRARAGAPFDGENASRMRWVGLLLLAFALFSGLAEAVTSQAVRSGVVGGKIATAAGLHVDPLVVFVGLALVALAEVFRRGAELEDEQSLVV